MIVRSEFIKLHDDVAKFHRACDFPVTKQNFYARYEPEHFPKHFALRNRMLNEEIVELDNALCVGDRVQILDALVDICYIAVGTICTFGIETYFLDDFLSDRVNLSEITPQTALFNIHVHMADLNIHCASMKSSIFPSYHHHHHKSSKSITGRNLSIVSQAFKLAYHHAFPIMRAWDLVQAANMAKVGPDGKVLKNVHGKVIKPDGWTPPDIASLLTGENK